MDSSLDTTFAALAAPARRAILAHLEREPARVADLAAPFAMSQQAVSKHVAVLVRAGLIRQRRVGREHWCELESAPLVAARSWIDRHTRLWNDRLDRLERVLADAIPAEDEA